MAVSNSDTVILPDAAIPLSEFQNASSRLTLVLCPPRTTDRFTIRDFILGLVLNSGFIPVVGMTGKETGSTDDAWERHGLFRCGAFIAARSHRPSINIRKRPPNICNQVYQTLCADRWLPITAVEIKNLSFNDESNLADDESNLAD